MEQLIHLKKSVRNGILTFVCTIVLLGGLVIISFLSWLLFKNEWFYGFYGGMFAFLAITILTKGKTLKPILTWSECLKKGIKESYVKLFVFLGMTCVPFPAFVVYCILSKVNDDTTTAIIMFLTITITGSGSCFGNKIASWIIKKARVQEFDNFFDDLRS